MRERRKKARLAGGPMIDERRAYVRLPQRSIMRVREFNFTDEPPRYFDAHYKNISGGGVLFESPYALPVGTILKLELRIPGWDRLAPPPFRIESMTLMSSQPLGVLGEVVRVETVQQDKCYDIGVVFIGIEDEQRRALMQFVASQYGCGPEGEPARGSRERARHPKRR
ncbi:MAG: PilZ domain-containing protein [Acidobacteriota bacterium]